MGVTQIVIGGAGFIGSNLVNKLVGLGENVVVIDNLYNGKIEFLNNVLSKIRFLEIDASNSESFSNTVTKFLEFDKDISIWHMAANSNIQNSQNNSLIDYRYTLGTTLSVIELCKYIEVKNFIFASSSAIYGDHGKTALSENFKNYSPSSNYGLMKLASEFLIGLQLVSQKKTKVRIFRFPNVVGHPMTHGLIYDLYHKLLADKRLLKVLGDGTQKKPFIHVDRLIDSMLYLLNTSNLFEVFNIGPIDDGIEIRTIAQELVEQLAPDCKLEFGKERFGWIGDIPEYRFDISKAIKAGADLNFNSIDAVRQTILEITKLSK